LHRFVERICGDARWRDHTIVATHDVAVAKASVRQLLAAGLLQRTVLLWVAYFCSLFVFYLLSSWLPTIMREAGHPISAAARIAAMAPLGGTIGALVLARLMDRLNPYYVLAASYLGSSLALGAIGLTIDTPGWLAVAVFCAGFGVVGGQTGMNALAATLYPTQIRATGVSWALAMGRIGSIVGAISGGMLMTLFADTRTLFQLIAFPPVLGAIALACLSAAQRRQTAAAAVLLGSDAP
jgi:AAHS family 4-hydroxybenzoate transporter-like MFS transporter